MRVIAVCLLAIAAVIGAPLTASADSTVSAPPAPWGYTGGQVAHGMAFAPRPQSAPAGAHLTYFGGPVISNVSVQSVYWGAGTYEPGVGPGQTQITEFLQGVTDSAHLDWLSEYNTPTQHIGRGRYQGQATINVSPLNAGVPDAFGTKSISNNNIANELDRQITSGALPPPELDAAGQVKTLYAVFFPSTITIQDGTAIGGEVGGFCAYHSMTLHDGLAVPFMVLPDFQTHHFAQGCGTDDLLFNNFTAVTAHELVESITDPNLASPAWGDANLGQEIADLCQPDHGTIVGGNGATYVVQKEFSNADNTCVVSRNVAAPVSTTYLNACGLASRTGFVDAGLAADCLKQYGVALGKNDGTFGENDGLVRSQVSSLLARLVELSGATLTQRGSFPDVTPATIPNAQVLDEIELLAGSGIIAGFPDGQFHPSDNLSVAQAVALVTRTLAFIHAANPLAPAVVDQGTTGADYAAAITLGLLDTHAANVRGFEYASAAGDVTDRGLLADVLAQATQRLVSVHVVAAV